MVVLGISLCIVWPHGEFICTFCSFHWFCLHWLFLFFFFSCIFSLHVYSFRFHFLFFFFSHFLKTQIFVHFWALTLFSKSDSSASSTSDAFEFDVAVVADLPLTTISSSFKYGILSHINCFTFLFGARTHFIFSTLLNFEFWFHNSEQFTLWFRDFFLKTELIEMQFDFSIISLAKKKKISINFAKAYSYLLFGTSTPSYTSDGGIKKMSKNENTKRRTKMVNREI